MSKKGKINYKKAWIELKLVLRSEMDNALFERDGFIKKNHLREALSCDETIADMGLVLEEFMPNIEEDFEELS